MVQSMLSWCGKHILPCHTNIPIFYHNIHLHDIKNNFHLGNPKDITKKKSNNAQVLRISIWYKISGQSYILIQ